MTERLDLGAGLDHALEASVPGAAGLHDLVRELLGGIEPTDPPHRLYRLTSRVFRFENALGTSWRSIVIKCLEPAVAQRTRLVVDRWLPALGMSECAARLIGSAADRQGSCVWHACEDLGVATLANRLEPERIAAAVGAMASLHARAARHPILPDARRYAGYLGVQYFTANVSDAIAAIERVRNAGIEPPAEYAGVLDRLVARLLALLADAPRRAQVFFRAGGPDTLLHGDLWPINIFVSESAGGFQARFIDWDRMGIGPFSYDLSTFVFRFPPAERDGIVQCYINARAAREWRVPEPFELDVLLDTSERARYANRIIWPAQALVQNRAAWAFPELAEVERWFQDLDSAFAARSRSSERTQA